MVSARHLRILETVLKVAQGLTVLGIVLVCWTTAGRFAAPLRTPVAVQAAATSEQSNPRAERTMPLKWYAPIWQRDLRQPPIPPPVKPALKPKKKSKPPPPLPRLLGTFVEDERRWAHFAGAGGKQRVLRTGAVIDRYTIVAIEPGRVQLQNADDLRWVEVPKPKPKGSKHR